MTLPLVYKNQCASALIAVKLEGRMPVRQRSETLQAAQNVTAAGLVFLVCYSNRKDRKQVSVMGTIIWMGLILYVIVQIIESSSSKRQKKQKKQTRIEAEQKRLAQRQQAADRVKEAAKNRIENLDAVDATPQAKRSAKQKKRGQQVPKQAPSPQAAPAKKSAAAAAPPQAPAPTQSGSQQRRAKAPTPNAPKPTATSHQAKGQALVSPRHKVRSQGAQTLKKPHLQTNETPLQRDARLHRKPLKSPGNKLEPPHYRLK